MKPGVPAGTRIAEISLRPGAGGDGDQRGDVGARVGDERLGAVDHPLAVVEHGAGLGGAGVGAGLGLGQPEAGERPAGDEVGQPPLLLLVGAEGQDRVDAEPDAGLERDADRLVDAAELLDRDAQRGEVAAAAAVLLGDDQAEQAELAHRVHERRPGSGARGPTAATCGATSRLGEVAHDLAEGLVVLGQLERFIVPAPRRDLTFTSTSSNDSRVTRARRKSATRPGPSASSPTSSASPPARCASTRPRACSAPQRAGTNRVYSRATAPGCG